jgi:hypothetical protein
MQIAGPEPTVTERGVHYALGRTTDAYGIWRTDAIAGAPTERFPLTAAGWFAARRRFAALEDGESSGTPAPSAFAGAAPTVPVTSAVAVSTRSLQISIGLLMAGIVFGLIGLFPSYIDGASLSSQHDELVSHIFYLTAWSATAIMLAGERSLRRAAAAFGAGASIITLGFFLTDLANGVTGTGSTVGTGLTLSLIGWALCALGAVGAFITLQRGGESGRAVFTRRPLVGLGGLAAVAIAATFGPSWDRYVVAIGTTGQKEVITAGNAFADPGLVIATSLVVMILTVAVIIVAFEWLPRIVGGALLLGALLPHIAQMFSAVSQAMMTPSLSQFGFSAASAAEAHVSVSSGLTIWFYLYCASIAVALALGVWNLRPHTTTAPTAPPLRSGDQSADVPAFRAEPVIP